MAKKSAKSKGYRRQTAKKPYLSKRDIAILCGIVAVLAVAAFFLFRYDDGALKVKDGAVVTEGDNWLIANGSNMRGGARYYKLGEIGEIDGYSRQKGALSSDANIPEYTFTPAGEDAGDVRLTVPCGHGRAAGRTFLHVERCAAIVAEFPVAGGLAAFRTERGAAFDFALPDLRGFGGFVDVAAHGFAVRLGDVPGFSGSAVGAKPFVLVPAVGTDPFVAGGAFLKTGTHLFLRRVECLFVFLAPLRRLTFKSAAHRVAAAFQSIADIARRTAEHSAQCRSDSAEFSRAGLLLVGGGRNESALHAVAAAVAVKFKLKSRVG